MKENEKKLENSSCEVGCGWSLYGKLKLTKKNGKNDYHGLKHHCYSCLAKDACISASRESKEWAEEQLAKESYDEALKSDCDDRYDEDGAPVESQEASVEETYGLITDDEEKQEKLNDYICEKFGLNPVDRQKGIEIIRRLAALYFDVPKSFESLMRISFKGQSQAEQARLRGCSRAAVSSGIVSEYAGMTRVKPNFPKELQGIELPVYQICFVDGCTIRSAAQQLHLSKSFVNRVGQTIASKLGKNGTRKNPKKKKIQTFFRRTRGELIRSKIRSLKNEIETLKRSINRSTKRIGVCLKEIIKLEKSKVKK